MELSVIIPCRGQARELRACVRSVAAQRASFRYEVIVVDSGGDGSVAESLHGEDRIRMVRAAVPLFPGSARNLGVQHAQGDRLAFIDADCVAEPGWLAAAGSALGQDTVRMVGGPVLDLRPGNWIAAADNLLQFAELPASRPRGPARYFPSCNMALRRDDFLSLAGFIEAGPHGGEDILFCETLLARWPGGLRFEPEMQVRHAGRGTVRELFRHQRAFGYSRALYRLHLKRWHFRLGRFRALIPAVALKRLSYVLGRRFRFGGREARRAILLSPLVSIALLWYATGFSRGCREGARRARSRPGPPA